MQQHSGHCHNNQFQDFQTPTIRAGSPILELRLNESISRPSPQPHVKPKPWSSHNNGLFCQFGITTSPTQTFEGTAQHRINLTKPTQLGLHLWERQGKKKKKKRVKFGPNISVEILILDFTSIWDIKDQHTSKPAAANCSFFHCVKLARLMTCIRKQKWIV